MDNKGTKRLSVIIPGYNTPKAWWRRCVQSVLAACGPDDEVICVDDGSETPVADFWQEICDGDKRARLLPLEKNVGLANARNAAMRVIQGRFVAFVDSDDEILPDTYRTCFVFQEHYDCDIVLYGVKVIWLKDSLYKDDILETDYFGVLRGVTLLKISKANLFDYACNKIYDANFITRNGLVFDSGATPGEDTVFNLRCVMAKAKWGVVGYQGYIYYRYDGSLLSRYVPYMRHSLESRRKAWKDCMMTLPDSGNLIGEADNESDSYIERAEWKNLWRRGTPFSLLQRWRYLVAHPKVARMPLLLEYIYTWLYSFVRRHFYFSWIRKRHIRSMYPQVKVYREVKQ